MWLDVVVVLLWLALAVVFFSMLSMVWLMVLDAKDRWSERRRRPRPPWFCRCGKHVVYLTSVRIGGTVHEAGRCYPWAEAIR